MVDLSPTEIVLQQIVDDLLATGRYETVSYYVNGALVIAIDNHWIHLTPSEFKT